MSTGAPASAPPAVRFDSRPRGAIAAGRRRLGWIFGTAAAAAAAAGALAFYQGRIWTGLIALAVACVPLFAWRMSGDLVPVWIEVAGRRLTVRTRARLFTYALDGAAARPLTGEERAHLAALASVGGVAASSGGFDSHRLGEFDLFAGDQERAVLVEAGDDRLVLTPDDPAAFVALVAERTGAPPR